MKNIVSANWVFRLRASFYHLLVSGFIAGICAVLVFGVWYPSPYFILSGGVGLFVLVAGIDLILGPLLTLVVFDVKKTRLHLIRDVSTIAFLQMGALGFGVYTVYSVRPVVLAAENLLFHVVTANDVATDELAEAPEKFQRLSITGPRLVGVRLAATGEEKLDSIAKALAGWDSGARPTYWEDYEQTKPRVIGQLKAIDQLTVTSSKREELKELLRQLKQTSISVGYAEVKARASGWIILVERETGKPLKFFDAGL